MNGIIELVHWERFRNTIHWEMSFVEELLKRGRIVSLNSDMRCREKGSNLDQEWNELSFRNIVSSLLFGSSSEVRDCTHLGRIASTFCQSSISLPGDGGTSAHFENKRAKNLLAFDPSRFSKMQNGIGVPGPGVPQPDTSKAISFVEFANERD